MSKRRGARFAAVLVLTVVWALACGGTEGGPGTLRAGNPAATQVPAGWPDLELVRLPAGYAVGRTLVTQGQYQEIMGENPSWFRGDDRRPVDSVGWEEATTFCQRLTARERRLGRLPADWRYDLPTDAQFDEFSAGARLADAVTSLAKPRESTEPVGTFPPSPLGLADVFGDVWQWCRDWYTDPIRRKDANPDVPPSALGLALPAAGPGDGPDSADPPDERYKVLRGGAWDTTPADDFKPATRLRYAVGMANNHTGFRCVLVPDAPSDP